VVESEQMGVCWAGERVGEWRLSVWGGGGLNKWAVGVGEWMGVRVIYIIVYNWAFSEPGLEVSSLWSKRDNAGAFGGVERAGRMGVFFLKGYEESKA